MGSGSKCNSVQQRSDVNVGFRAGDFVFGRAKKWVTVTLMTTGVVENRSDDDVD